MHDVSTRDRGITRWRWRRYSHTGKHDPRRQLDRMGSPRICAARPCWTSGPMTGSSHPSRSGVGARSEFAIDQPPADHYDFALTREILLSYVDYRVASVYDLVPRHSAISTWSSFQASSIISGTRCCPSI